MAGSSFGSIFRITTWGESHGAGLGVVVDGCPAGLPLCEEDIQIFLNRRKPGQSKFATPRKEDDTVEILSGVFEGVQDMPTTLLMKNTVSVTTGEVDVPPVGKPLAVWRPELSHPNCLPHLAFP